jgi:phosphoglycolate phosphatase
MNSMTVFLFDVDGTLINAGGAGRRAMENAFEELYGVENAFGHENFTGRTDPLIFRDCYLKHLYVPPSPEEFRRFFKKYIEKLKKEVPESREYKVLPSVREFLDFLKTEERVVFGLCTGNLEEGARLKLIRGGLWDYFIFGGFGSDALERVEITRIAVQRARKKAACDVSPERIFIVGDSPHEIRCAHEIGVRSLILCTGWTEKEDLIAEKPDHIFDDLGNYQNWIHEIIRCKSPT